MIYWLDSSVLIQSRHKYHTKERVPEFWQWLDEKLDAGVIRMPHRAFKEVTDGNDWLVPWCKLRKNKGLDVPKTDEIEAKYKALSAYVSLTYKHTPRQVMEHLRGADGWVIAYAMALGGVVVSEEDRARKNDTSSIKIPNICRAQKPKVPWVDTFGMLDAIGDWSK